jgi:transcriptional regulator with XRE-family HTH domain
MYYFVGSVQNDSLFYQQFIMKYDRSKLGERIFLERRRKNYSQAKMADILGVSRNTLSSYETGKSDINLDSFSKLCNEVGKTPNEILL